MDINDLEILEPGQVTLGYGKKAWINGGWWQNHDLLPILFYPSTRKKVMLSG